MSPELRLRISDVSMRDDGVTVSINIEFDNPTNQTLHVYATPRKVQYDAATRTLTVYLTDRNTDQLQGGMIVHPKLRAIDPKEKTVVTITLPRVMNRLAGSEGTPIATPKFERLPIHEADTIEVFVAWGDQPFYPDARPTRRAATVKEQLVLWEKGVVRG